LKKIQYSARAQKGSISEDPFSLSLPIKHQNLQSLEKYYESNISIKSIILSAIIGHGPLPARFLAAFTILSIASSTSLCVRVVVASIEQKSLQFDRAIERLHDNRIFTGV